VHGHKLKFIGIPNAVSALLMSQCPSMSKMQNAVASLLAYRLELFGLCFDAFQTLS
jgi:hypothetical protein